MTEIICQKCWVSGRVQGVFFRDSTATRARQLGVTGYAINRADGRVEILACGDATAVKDLIQWLHKGPPASRVDRVVSEKHECKVPSNFGVG